MSVSPLPSATPAPWPDEADVRRYLSLPYGITLTRSDSGDEPTWHAQIEEMPGCEAVGTTPAEAAERVPAALAEWVAEARAEGREVPEPRSPRSYSGKLLLRMPLTLHAELARAAERDQVSLNAYITSQLAVAVGWRRPDAPRVAAGSQTPRRQRDKLLWWALVVNLAVVAIAGIIAVGLLITAWAGG
jgi:antitoxin HicB